MTAAVDGTEDWDEAPAGLSGGRAGQAVQPFFGSVEDFVADYLSLVTEVRTGGPVVWCSSRWADPEAIARLTALWRAWEALRLEPGMSNWWALHFDPHMRVLLDAEPGPFASCTRGPHHDGKPSPLTLLEPPK